MYSWYNSRIVSFLGVIALLVFALVQSLPGAIQGVLLAETIINDVDHDNFILEEEEIIDEEDSFQRGCYTCSESFTCYNHLRIAKPGEECPGGYYDSQEECDAACGTPPLVECGKCNNWKFSTYGRDYRGECPQGLVSKEECIGAVECRDNSYCLAGEVCDMTTMQCVSIGNACGNGLVDTTLNEECDESSELSSCAHPFTCNACRCEMELDECGNGVLNGGEVCDGPVGCDPGEVCGLGCAVCLAQGDLPVAPIIEYNPVECRDPADWVDNDPRYAQVVAACRTDCAEVNFLKVTIEKCVTDCVCKCTDNVARGDGITLYDMCMANPKGWPYNCFANDPENCCRAYAIHEDCREVEDHGFGGGFGGFGAAEDGEVAGGGGFGGSGGTGGDIDPDDPSVGGPGTDNPDEPTRPSPPDPPPTPPDPPGPPDNDDDGSGDNDDGVPDNDEEDDPPDNDDDGDGVDDDDIVENDEEDEPDPDNDDDGDGIDDDDTVDNDEEDDPPDNDDDGDGDDDDGIKDDDEEDEPDPDNDDDGDGDDDDGTPDNDDTDDPIDNDDDDFVFSSSSSSQGPQSSSTSSFIITFQSSSSLSLFIQSSSSTSTQATSSSDGSQTSEFTSSTGPETPSTSSSSEGSFSFSSDFSEDNDESDDDNVAPFCGDGVVNTDDEECESTDQCTNGGTCFACQCILNFHTECQDNLCILLPGPGDNTCVTDRDCRPDDDDDDTGTTGGTGGIGGIGGTGGTGGTDDDDGQDDDDDGIPDNDDDDFSNDDDGQDDDDDGIPDNDDENERRISETYIASSTFCGNGTLDPGEECDDRNRLSGDGCSNACLLEIGICGDGIIQSLLGEQCEPSMHDSSLEYACVNCLTYSQKCGDGNLDPGESCDDGPLNSTSPNATCRPDCHPRRCGDGALDAGEQCDDGNTRPYDGCSQFCLVEGDTQIAAQQQFIVGPNGERIALPFPQIPASLTGLPDPIPLAQLQPIVQSRGPAGETGPAAIAIIGAGAAGGMSWMRRRKRKSDK